MKFINWLFNNVSPEGQDILQDKIPHIQLYDFKEGFFPNEKIGYYLDSDGKKKYIEVQKCNSNFTQEGLLEVKVCEIEGDKALIQVCNEWKIDNGIIKTSDLKYFNKNELQYLKENEY